MPCTNHVLGNGCDDACAVDRKALESRVLTGLRERMMTPEIDAEVMRAYSQETNRLNRQRRSSLESTRHELAEARKGHRGDRARHQQRGWHRALSDRLTELVAKQTASPPAERTP